MNILLLIFVAFLFYYLGWRRGEIYHALGLDEK